MSIDFGNRPSELEQPPTRHGALVNTLSTCRSVGPRRRVRVAESACLCVQAQTSAVHSECTTPPPELSLRARYNRVLSALARRGLLSAQAEPKHNTAPTQTCDRVWHCTAHGDDPFPCRTEGASQSSGAHQHKRAARCGLAYGRLCFAEVETV